MIDKLSLHDRDKNRQTDDLVAIMDKDGILQVESYQVKKLLDSIELFECKDSWSITETYIEKEAYS